jgi:hypothetical protein
MSEQEIARREVIQRAMYVAPAVLTLVAIPAFASVGSGAESPQRGADYGSSWDTDESTDSSKRTAPPYRFQLHIFVASLAHFSEQGRNLALASAGVRWWNPAKGDHSSLESIYWI